MGGGGVGGGWWGPPLCFFLLPPRNDAAGGKPSRASRGPPVDRGSGGGGDTHPPTPPQTHIPHSPSLEGGRGGVRRPTASLAPPKERIKSGSRGFWDFLFFWGGENASRAAVALRSCASPPPPPPPQNRVFQPQIGLWMEEEGETVAAGGGGREAPGGPRRSGAGEELGCGRGHHRARPSRGTPPPNPPRRFPMAKCRVLHGGWGQPGLAGGGPRNEMVFKVPSRPKPVCGWLWFTSPTGEDGAGGVVLWRSSLRRPPPPRGSSPTLAEVWGTIPSLRKTP